MELLDIRDLAVSYATGEGPVPALRGVDLTVSAGEIVGVAGESGCGVRPRIVSHCAYLEYPVNPFYAASRRPGCGKVTIR